MAMRDCCGFEGMLATDIDERYDLLSGAIPSIIAGRNGNGVKISSLQSIWKVNLPNHAVYGTSFALKITDSFLSGRGIFSFLDGITEQVDIATETLGQIQVRRNASTVLGTSANGVLILNTWHHIQFQVTISNTVGVYEVKVDGVTVLSGTGANTRHTANAFANGFRLGGGGNSSAPMYFDDLYVYDGSGSINNTFPGDVRVFQVAPSGAGNSAQFTPSAGSNYQCVDEATPNTTDYVSSQTVGNKDTYAFQDIAGTGTPLGAMVTVYARKADAGPARGIKAVCRSGSSEALSSEAIISPTWRYWLQSVFETDPATAVAWASVSAINAAEFGVQVTT